MRAKKLTISEVHVGSRRLSWLMCYNLKKRYFNFTVPHLLHSTRSDISTAYVISGLSIRKEWEMMIQLDSIAVSSFHTLSMFMQATLSSVLFTNSEIAMVANCGTRGVRRIRLNVRYYSSPQKQRGIIRTSLWRFGVLLRVVYTGYPPLMNKVVKVCY